MIRYIAIAVVFLAVVRPAFADTLTAEDAKNLLGLLSTVQIQGAQAPAFMALVGKLQGMATPPAPQPAPSPK